MNDTRHFDFSDLGLWSGPPAPAFVSGSRLAAELMGVEYGKVTLLDLDRDRTLIPAAHGFDPEALGLDWSVTDLPLCQKIIAGREIVEIGEVNDIASARQSPFLRALGARSYLGAPIFDPAGTPIGTLCVIGRRPRIWSARQKEQLTDLAGLLSQAITLKAALATVRLLSPSVTQG